MSRAIMAPQFSPSQSYSGPPPNAMIANHQQIQHQNPFSFGGAYTGPQSASIVPAFAANYIQQRPLPRSMQQDNEVRAIAYSGGSRPDFVEEHSNQSPLIKSEPIWGVSSGSPPTPVTFSSTNTKPISSTTSPIATTDVNFGTDVDTLMKAIQAKSQTSDPQTPAIEHSRPVVNHSPTPPYSHTNSQSARYASSDLSPVKLTREQQHKENHSSKSSKKRYQCTIENCTKKFQQKTHLDIHERSHTGIKPYVSYHNTSALCLC
jgi:hypothetical protein